MTLEQLRVFVAVAECRARDPGGEELNLTQSAASAAVAALEERHGVKLFDRIGRRIALTAAGQVFLSEAKAVLARAGPPNARSPISPGLKTGELCSPRARRSAVTGCRRGMVAFRTLYPGFRSSCASATLTTSRRWRAPARSTSASSKAKSTTPRSPSRPSTKTSSSSSPRRSAATLEAADARALNRAPWVAREKGSGTREAFEATLTAFGVAAAERETYLELPSNEAVRAAVEAGAGLAVMSRLVAAASLNAGALVASPLVLPRRRYICCATRSATNRRRPAPSPRPRAIRGSRAPHPIRRAAAAIRRGSRSRSRARRAGVRGADDSGCTRRRGGRSPTRHRRPSRSTTGTRPRGAQAKPIERVLIDARIGLERAERVDRKHARRTARSSPAAATASANMLGRPVGEDRGRKARPAQRAEHAGDLGNGGEACDRDPSAARVGSGRRGRGCRAHNRARRRSPARNRRSGPAASAATCTATACRATARSAPRAARREARAAAAAEAKSNSVP